MGGNGITAGPEKTTAGKRPSRRPVRARSEPEKAARACRVPTPSPRYFVCAADITEPIANRLYLYAQSSVLGHAGARATSVELRFSSQGVSRLLSLLPNHLLSRPLLPFMLITAAPFLSFLAAAT